MSSSIVYNNPVLLREFSGQLGRFSHLIEDTLENLRSNLDRLGDTWQDEQYEEFCNTFMRVHKLLERFIPVARQSVTDLNGDAAVLEGFQRSKL